MNENKRYHLSNEDIAELVKISRMLNPGESVSATIYVEPEEEEESFSVVPFSQRETTEGPELFTFNEPRKPKPSFHLLKEKIIRKFTKLGEKIGELMTSNGLLEYYKDEEGKYYYFEENTVVYLDPRGFEYYEKYIPNLDKRVSYIMLSYNSGEITFGTFVDKERTLLLADGEIYEVNEKGELSASDKINYIGSHRK